MRRGEFYRVSMPPGSARPARVYMVASRNEFLEVPYSTVACIPVYSTRLGLSTEVAVGEAEGLQRPSALRCDEITSLARSRLRDFVGSLSAGNYAALATALMVALALESPGDEADRGS